MLNDKSNKFKLTERSQRSTNYNKSTNELTFFIKDFYYKEAN